MCVCIVEGRADAISYKRESPTVPGPSVESRSCVSLPFSREKSRGGRSIGTLTVCVHVRSVTALEPVPAPVQSAAVFRDARSSSLSRDRVTFFVLFFVGGGFLLLLLLLGRLMAVSSVQGKRRAYRERREEGGKQSIITQRH